MVSELRSTEVRLVQPLKTLVRAELPLTVVSELRSTEARLAQL